MAQTISPDSLPGTWIGIDYEWDTDTRCPIASYLRFSADSSYVVGAVNGLGMNPRHRWAVLPNGAVRLDTNQFAPGQIRIKNTLLYVGGYFPMRFRRFQDVPMVVDTVRKYLVNKIWQSDSQTLYLYENGQAGVEERDTVSETSLTAPTPRLKKYWSLARMQNSVFLLIQGSIDDKLGNFRPVMQVVSNSPATFRVIIATGQSADNEEFKSVGVLSPGDTCQAIGFQPCVSCLYRPLTMYYSFDQKGHSNRLYFVKTVFQKHYKPFDLPGQSGLIRIRFQVNCRGEAGRFSLLELDPDYTRRPFDRRISSQLLAICEQRLATGWVAGASVRNGGPGNPTDYVQFITFRLADGQITEIFP